MDHNDCNRPGDASSGVTISSAFRSLPRAKRIAVLLTAAALLTITTVISGLIGRGTATIPAARTGDVMARTLEGYGETAANEPAAAMAGETSTDSPAAPTTTEPTTEPPTTEPPTTEPPTTAEPTTEETTVPENARDYVVNTNTGKFHYPTCSSVGDMNPANRSNRTCAREDLLAEGYVPCKRCNP